MVNMKIMMSEFHSYKKDILSDTVGLELDKA